jgi:hypothetical protein
VVSLFLLQSLTLNLNELEPILLCVSFSWPGLENQPGESGDTYCLLPLRRFAGSHDIN